jgi:hypothetical protein
MRGVIETIIHESHILENLPFIEINGNALTYNRELTIGGAQFYNVGDTWVESTPTFTPASATITILGGDADVDSFVKQTRSNVQDVEAETLESKIKGMTEKFDDTFVNGSVTTDPKSFDGLITLVNADTLGGQYIGMGTVAGSALTLPKMDELIDTVKPGKPDLLIMSKACRRSLTSLARTSGSSGVMSTEKSAFGRLFQTYNDVPISICDWQSDVETFGTSATTCTSIYAVKFGEKALCGLTNGWINVENLGQLEIKDATRHRVKWYCGLALFNIYAAARLGGIVIN